MTFFQNVIALIKANLFVQGAGVIKGIVIKRILGPQAVGIFAFMQLVLGYVQFFNLGTPTAASRELPYWHGKDDIQAQDRIRSTLFATTLFESAIAGALFFVYLFRYHDPGTATFWALFPVPIFALAMKIAIAMAIAFESLQQFVLLGKIYTLQSVVDFALKISFALLWGLSGLIVAFGIVLAINVALFFVYSKKLALFTIRPRFYISHLKRLLRIGIPLEVAAYGGKVFNTLDSLLVTLWLGTGSLAYYSVGAGLFLQLSEIPSKVGTVLMPKIMQTFGKSDDLSAVKTEVFRFLVGNVTVVVPFICASGFWGGEWLIRIILPRFLPAIPVIHILVFGLFFIPQRPILNLLFVIKEQLLRYIVIVLIGICILFGAIKGATLTGRQLDQIAYGTLGGYGLYFLVLFFTATQRVLPIHQSLTFLVFLFVSMAYTYVTIRFMNRLLPTHSHALVETGYSLLRVGGAIPLLLPLAVIGIRHIGLWDAIRGKVSFR